MDEVVIGALQRILRDGGVEILGDARRFEALLRDHCPHSRAEVNLAVVALKERVPHDLRSDGGNVGILRGRLIRRLEESYFLPTEAAARAVDGWATVLSGVGGAEWLMLTPPVPSTDSGVQSRGAPTVTRRDFLSSAFPSQSPAQPAKPLREAARTVGAISVNPIDGATWVWVPPGSFTMGSPPGQGRDSERPAHRVTITHGFQLYQHPVTNEQYRWFVTAAGQLQPDFWDSERFNAPQQPVVGVNWSSARAYCEWAMARLPTEAEWEYAARGPESRVHPWGCAGPDKTRAVFGQSLVGGRPAEVGGRPRGVSWCGAHDMAGNVWEWCEDVWNAMAYRARHGSVDDPLETGVGPHVVRGGAWDLNKDDLRAAVRGHSFFDGRRYALGFRPVVVVPHD